MRLIAPHANLAPSIEQRKPSSPLFQASVMADDWDDWGDDKAQSDHDNSEGWDWPTATEGSTEPAATPALLEGHTISRSRRLVEESNQGESDEGQETGAQRARQVSEMADKHFVELQKYQEDLADPSVREEINKVPKEIGVGWY